MNLAAYADPCNNRIYGALVIDSKWMLEWSVGLLQDKLINVINTFIVANKRAQKRTFWKTFISWNWPCMKSSAQCDTYVLKTFSILNENWNNFYEYSNSLSLLTDRMIIENFVNTFLKLHLTQFKVLFSILFLLFGTEMSQKRP